jgi:thioesterase domain-containing protein
MAVVGVHAHDLPSLPTDLPSLAHVYGDVVAGRSSTAPYLCGWSAGGVIAYELAVQLEARGRRVAGLVLIDSYLLPPNLAEHSALLAYANEVMAELHSSGDRLRLLEEARAMAEPERQVALKGALARALDIDDREVEDRLRVYTALRAIVTGYRPERALACPIHVVSPRPQICVRNWGGLIAHAATITVEGDHYSIMRPPGVAAVGRALLEITSRRAV